MTSSPVFPSSGPPQSPVSECIYPDFSLIQLKMGAEVLSLPNMFLQRQKKKASRQIKAKKILNLLITQLNSAVTDRGNECFIRALWYEWGFKRETQRGNQEQLQGDGEWIKRCLHPCPHASKGSHLPLRGNKVDLGADVTEAQGAGM